MKHRLWIATAAVFLLAGASPAPALELEIVGSAVDGEPIERIVYGSRLSPDEGFITFRTWSKNLHPDYVDDGTVPRHWLLDIADGSFSPLATNLSTATSFGGAAAVSLNRRYAVFASAEGHRLDPAVPEEHRGELLFRKDLETGTAIAFPRRMDGEFTRDGGRVLHPRFHDRDVSISPDGRYVVFRSDLRELAPGQSSDNLFAWDSESDTVTLLSTNSTGLHPAWFLDDGRLVTTMRLDEDSPITPVVFDTIYTPPDRLLDVDNSSVARYVTPDGRYVFIEEIHANRFVRVDLTNGARTDVCTTKSLSSPACDIHGASLDGRYLLLRGEVEDLARKQAISASVGHPHITADGLALYGLTDAGFVRRPLRAVDLRLTTDARHTVSDDDSVVTLDVRIDNRGQHTANDVHVSIWWDKEASSGDPQMSPDPQCPDIPVHRPGCTLSLNGGESFAWRVEFAGAGPGTYEIRAGIALPYQWLREPAVFESSAKLRVDPLPPPPPPPPPPQLREGGGGGNAGWIWLVLVLLQARRRTLPMMASPGGFEPPSPP